MKRMDVAENFRVLSFNFSHQLGQKIWWVINLAVGPATIKAHAPQIMGGVNKKAKAVWKLILCPTGRSAMEGSLSLLEPTWATVRNPWCTSMVELLEEEGMRRLDWVLVPRITPLECLAVWRMLLSEERQPIEIVIWIVWSLRVELKVILPVVDGPSLKHSVIMNIIVWNCRGALKPSFQRHVRELIRCHNPVMLVVMETRIGGERAREITDRLPFDGAIHTETIGYAGGLWLLWNSDRVEITALANTEQEIHTIVKMTNSGLITDHSSCNNGSIPSACDEDEILSPESSEASSESLVNTSEGNHEVKSHRVPEIGMKFSCEEEALKFYKKYAMEMGFKVRKGKVQRLADKSLAKRYFYCSKEGFRSKKQPTNMKKYTRKETRTGCNAMIQIKFKNKECSISHFISYHNHALKGSTEKYIDSCSEIPEADSLIPPICGIEVAKEAEAGAYARFCDMSYGKHLPAKKSNILQPEDAQGLIDNLKKLQVEDLSLFYTFQVDAKSHMTNFFWRDSRSKIDYYYFGDVLILDTTFKTDRYNMICAPFLGLNHHRRHVLFGCAFLLDESVESFTWLLGTFMEAMGRRQPKTIFTTECRAIAEAIEVTLPKSQHLLCKQLVCQNAKQHLSMYSEQPKFESHFHSCLFDCQSKEEFQSTWESLLEQYNLHVNPWLQNMYTLRSKWSYLFSKITFCAGIHSNQGSENFSNANIFQNGESEAMILPDYFLKYEKAAEQQRMEELEDDSFCMEPKSMLSSTPMYIQAANVYTPTMLEIFRREFIESISVPLKRVTRTGSIVTYKVTKGGKIECMVEFNSSDSTITCSCKKFESVGILCAHAVKVLSTRNIFQIPSQYILKRWTKFAKDGVVEDGQNGEEIADNSESLCKSKFMDKALNVITKSVAVKKTRKIVERHLDIALKEVDDVLKKGSEHHNTKDAEVNQEDVRNTSSVARVGWKEKMLKALYLNQGETSKDGISNTEETQK